MLKAIKIRLYPNQEQEHYIANLLGTSRFIYNNLLGYKKDQYENQDSNVSFGEMGKKLVELKSEYDWIKNSHSKVLQQSIINLNTAFNNFFKNGSGYPKFKKKHDNKQSCRFPKDAISGIKGNRINIITKLKDIHYKCSTKDEKYLNKNQDLIKSGTLTRTKSGKYTFSILIDKPNKQLNKPKNDVIGIDLGIKDFVITSEGETYENIKIKRNNKDKLAKLHREVSRRKKGSSNRNKSRKKLAKYYEKLNNIKENYLHEVSNKLLDDSQVIVIEDLNVKGMVKNHKLARSIQELSLSTFTNMLEYKAEWYGREVVKIDRWYPSSKTCSCCGWKNDNLTLKDREFICQECGLVIDRDVNAGINIKNEGLRMLNEKSTTDDIINDYTVLYNNFSKHTIGLSAPELTPLESSPLGSH